MNEVRGIKEAAHPGGLAPEAEQAAADMIAKSEEAAAFLKALSHGGRLMILCHLASGEKSVSELEALLGSRQAAVSQQLARLRFEGLVNSRREGKVIYYSVSDPKALKLVEVVHALFCAPADLC